MKNVSISFCAIVFSASLLISACTKQASDRSTGQQLLRQDATAQQSATQKDSYRTFIINEGKHFCTDNAYPPFYGKSLFFTALFDSSAIYNFTDPATKSDQNTLYGFADNDRKHQRFSARFGWRWYNNELQLAAYTQNQGDSTIVEVGTATIGTPVDLGIVINGPNYDFYIGGALVKSLPRESNSRAGGLYKLFPYFGGNATAPHKITIKIKQ